MKPTQALLLIASTTLLCGVVGMGIGDAIGNVMPGYYRSVMHAESLPHFDPVAYGRGQGLTQGLAVGVAVALVLVSLGVWSDWRTNDRSKVQDLERDLRQVQQEIAEMKKSRDQA